MRPVLGRLILALALAPELLQAQSVNALDPSAA
jgi:hypothetical protein